MQPLKIFIFSIFIFSTLAGNTGQGGIDLAYQPARPEIFAEQLISTHLNERDITISPDGNRLLYTLSTFDNSRRTLVEWQKINGEWQETGVPSFARKHENIEPAFSPDGKSLFFASKRPLEAEEKSDNWNIWQVKLSNGNWLKPQALPEIINTETDEFYPSVAANGNLYFTAGYDKGVGLEDIYRSEFIDGKFKPPALLDSAVNTPGYEFNAYISPDEKLLVFSGYGREDGLGGGDLYFCQRADDGSWLPAKHLPDGINSKALDYCPFIDWRHGNLYFSSNRATPVEGALQTSDDLKSASQIVLNGQGNIFFVDMAQAGMN